MAGVFVSVRIAIDGALDALVLGVMPQPPVHVATQRAGIQLDPGAGCRAGVNDGGLIDFVGFAFEQQPPGEVAEDVNKRIFGGADQAPGHLRFALGEALMDAGHDHVQLGQKIVLKVQPAIGQDVHFRAGEETEIVALRRRIGG